MHRLFRHLVPKRRVVGLIISIIWSISTFFSGGLAAISRISGPNALQTRGRRGHARLAFTAAVSSRPRACGIGSGGTGAAPPPDELEQENVSTNMNCGTALPRSGRRRCGCSPVSNGERTAVALQNAGCRSRYPRHLRHLAPRATLAVLQGYLLEDSHLQTLPSDAACMQHRCAICCAGAGDFRRSIYWAASAMCVAAVTF